MMVTTRTLATFLLVTVLLTLMTMEASASRSQFSGRRSGGRRRAPLRRLDQCDTVPGFRVNGVEPLTQTRGRVTLAALLTSTCSFCLGQAESLENLTSSLPMVHMMIVNGGPRPRPGRQGPLESRVSFPVYHDNNDGTIWRRVFGGDKDDIFILDRCGKLTFRIPFPYSYLGYNYVRRALRRTLRTDVCDCSLSEDDPHDRMMGDAPSLGRRSGYGEGHGRRLSWGPGRRQGYRFRNGLGMSRNRHGGRGSNPSYGHIGNLGVRNQRRGGGSFVEFRRGAAGGPSYSHGGHRGACPRDDPLCRDMRRARRRFRQYVRHHDLGSQSDMSEEQILTYFQRSQGGRNMGPAF